MKVKSNTIDDTELNINIVALIKLLLSNRLCIVKSGIAITIH